MRKKIFIITSPLILILILIGCLFIFRGKILGSKNISVSQNSSEKNIPEIQNENSELVTIEPDSRQVSSVSKPIENTGIVSEEKNQTEPVNKKEEIQKESASKLIITDKLVSWGYASSSSRSIDTVIIHSSYDAIGSDPYSVTGLINEYKQYEVSPHYLIDRKGNIYRLVAEKNIAYHAGEGKTPDGRSGVNNFSIGIELMNQENTKFTDAQYIALKSLIVDIKSRYKIKYVMGHNQIAPGRKTDPWNFEWNKL
jgi:hypothetical protein